jgi:hypothetical protein
MQDMRRAYCSKGEVGGCFPHEIRHVGATSFGLGEFIISCRRLLNIVR